MSVVLMTTAVAAALVFVGVGVFSLLSLLWGDLLEGDVAAEPASSPVELSP